MTRMFLYILLIKGLNINSQTSNIHLLFENTYKLYKYTRGNNNVNVYEDPLFKKYMNNDILEIKRSKDYSDGVRKYFAKNGFSDDDTLSVVEWDIMGHNCTMFKKICKVKFILKDSCVLFYGEKVVEDQFNERFDKKTYITPRKFKLIKCTNKEVVLLDMDIINVKRTYYFWVTTKKK